LELVSSIWSEEMRAFNPPPAVVLDSVSYQTGVLAAKRQHDSTEVVELKLSSVPLVEAPEQEHDVVTGEVRES